MRPIIAILSAVFLVAGIFLIRYSLTQPCKIGELGLSAEGGMNELEEAMPELSINLPVPIQRMMCTFTDWAALSAILVGIAFTWGGARGLVMNCVYLHKEKKKHQKE